MVITQGAPPELARAERRPPGRRRWPALALAGLTLALAGASMLVGAGEVGAGQVWDYLRGDPIARADAQLTLVVADLRLPRTAAALAVGGALGVAGVLLQAATRNPLAETGLLGVNAGAALGVVTGITFTGAESGYAYLGWAFCGALVISALVLLVAAAGRPGASPLRLVLAGAALGMTCKGISSYLLLRAETTYDQYRFWLLGSLSGVELRAVLQTLPAVMLGLLLAAAVARPLSALALGDDVAQALGHRPGAVRVVAGTAVTLLAAAAVALAGPIAFLGLLAPYPARALAGPGIGGQLLPAACCGAALLLAADVLTRLVAQPYEAPASALIALVGAPVLIWLVRAGRVLRLDGQGAA